MEIQFTVDELILTLVGLIREVDPTLLRQGRNGFQVDFQTIERKEQHSEDERLLLKLRGALEGAGESGELGHRNSLTCSHGNRAAAGTLVGL